LLELLQSVRPALRECNQPQIQTEQREPGSRSNQQGTTAERDKNGANLRQDTATWLEAIADVLHGGPQCLQ